MDSIPVALTVDQESTTLGRRGFDMSVDLVGGETVQSGIISKIPPAVLDTVIAYRAVARLVLEIIEV